MGPEVIFHVLWGGLLVASLIVFFWWVGAGASVWLEVAATAPSPRPAYRAGLTIAGFVLAVWLGALFLIRDTKEILPVLFSSSDGVRIAVWSIVQRPLTLLVLVALWAFPLSAWFWRGRLTSAVVSSWPFLDPSSDSLALPRRPPLRPGLALTTGVAGGLVFFGLLLLISLGLRLGVSEAVRGTDAFRLGFFIGQVGLAALMQAGVAAVVAGRVEPLGALHGLFAAFAGGCVMAIGALGRNLLFGGTIDAALAWITFSHVVNEGALLALPVALSAFAFATRRRGVGR